MTFAQLLAAALAHLELAAIPYMVTASIASTYHGEARATRDLDIVIDPSPAELDRLVADLLGTPGHIATVEDMVVAKLEWAAATDSERQLRDVAGMLAVGGDGVDRDYIIRWVEALGLRQVWRRVRD